MNLLVNCAVPLGLALTLLAAPTVSAQEKCKLTWESPADTKYTQQLARDVGDIPGHQVRVREVHSVYRNDKPNCEGLKRTEVWDRGFSDYIDRNGRSWGYALITFENGDKIYTAWSGTSQTSVGQDGSKEGHYEGVTRWTGGTGKYATVRGFRAQPCKVNLDKCSAKPKDYVEYWFEK